MFHFRLAIIHLASSIFYLVSNHVSKEMGNLLGNGKTEGHRKLED
jgi:hypothetical protein